jgi:hypothetical protein
MPSPNDPNYPDPQSLRRFLLQAAPDFREQLHRLNDQLLQQNDGVDQSHDHLGKRIALIAPRIQQMPSKEAAQLQHSREFVEE